MVADVRLLVSLLQLRSGDIGSAAAAATAATAAAATIGEEGHVVLLLRVAVVSFAVLVLLGCCTRTFLFLLLAKLLDGKRLKLNGN